MYLEKITQCMEDVFRDHPQMVLHTLNVLKHGEDIMEAEGVIGEEKELISIVALLHDIGIVEARKKYGSSEGPYQEKEGARIAFEILKKVGYNKDIDRICYIIAHHHTPEKIDGRDFQIQWEADLIENLKSSDGEKIRRAIEENFKTAGGKELAYRLLLAPMG